MATIVTLNLSQPKDQTIPLFTITTLLWKNTLHQNLAMINKISSLTALCNSSKKSRCIWKLWTSLCSYTEISWMTSRRIWSRSFLWTWSRSSRMGTTFITILFTTFSTESKRLFNKKWLLKKKLKLPRYSTINQTGSDLTPKASLSSLSLSLIICLRTHNTDTNPSSPIKRVSQSISTRKTPKILYLQNNIWKMTSFKKIKSKCEREKSKPMTSNILRLRVQMWSP